MLGTRELRDSVGTLTFSHEVEVKDPEAPERRPRRGVALILKDSETDQFVLFRRSNLAHIAYPGRICLIGGGRHVLGEDVGGQPVYEEPLVALRRELSAELLHSPDKVSFDVGAVEPFARIIDDRPGEIDVFRAELPGLPADLVIDEGDGLVFLRPDEVLRTDLPYGFNQVMRTYVSLEQA